MDKHQSLPFRTKLLTKNMTMIFSKIKHISRHLNVNSTFLQNFQNPQLDPKNVLNSQKVIIFRNLYPTIKKTFKNLFVLVSFHPELDFFNPIHRRVCKRAVIPDFKYACSAFFYSTNLMTFSNRW